MVTGSCDFGDDFLARDHARQVFLDQETVQRHHAVLGAGLNVRLMRKVLLSRISAATDGVLIMISNTATRPGLSLRGISNCEITACSTVES